MFFLRLELELMESIWFRIKEMTCKDDIIVGVCYRPPIQVEQVITTIGVVSHLKVLILTGGFSHHDDCGGSTQ